MSSRTRRSVKVLGDAPALDLLGRNASWISPLD
jgi:hypothetical protein